MKKTIVSMAVVIIAAISLNAQQPYQPTKQKQHQQFRQYERGRLAKKIHFSDQQKEQLKNLHTDYRVKLMELKKHDEITVREYNLKMDGLRKDYRIQMQALLTPAQKEQITAMKQRGIEIAKVNAGARAAKMKIKLGLTDAQASKLKTIRTDMAVKMKSIHTDNALSREQKREQFKTLAMQQQAQLKTILTADQLQQLEDMKKQHHRRGAFAK